MLRMFSVLIGNPGRPRWTGNVSDKIERCVVTSKARSSAWYASGRLDYAEYVLESKANAIALC